MTDAAVDAGISLAERSAIAAEAVWARRVERFRAEANALIQKAALNGRFRDRLLSDDFSQFNADEMHRMAIALAAMPEFDELKWEVRLRQEDIGCGETKDVLDLWALWGAAYEEMPRVMPLRRPKNNTGTWVAIMILLVVLSMAVPNFF